MKTKTGVEKVELLPGDRDNLAIQTRGGPEKHEVTGWVLVSFQSSCEIFSVSYINKLYKSKC